MKKIVKIVEIPFLLLFCCLCSSITSAQSATVYTIEKSKSVPNSLTVHLDLTTQPPSNMTLTLYGASRGITKQVNNMRCNGERINENQPGVWLVPSGCQNIQWEVPLAQEGTVLASEQQSIMSGKFILFSEASSLPRLQNPGTPEILRISIAGVEKTFPVTDDSREIVLPGAHSAPLFVLINPTEADSASSETIKLQYFLDNSAAASKLPAISSHLKGIKWLNTIIPSRVKKNFNTVWLAIPASKLSLAGAAGSGILLTNYPDDGEFPFGQAMLLYVGLHEAFHQFTLHYPQQPTWVSESLASYYGVRALQIALPNDPNTTELCDRFLKSGTHFQNGLLVINREIAAGDRSEYGAFYTKGIAFWMAVDKALQEEKLGTLDGHLQAVLNATYDENGSPLDLPKILNLPPQAWLSLRKQFLD